MTSSSKRTPPLLLHEFQASLQGLRQLVDVVAPHAADLEGLSFMLNLDISDEAAAEVVSALQEISADTRGSKPLTPAELEHFNNRLKRAASEDPDGFRRLGMALQSGDYTPTQQELLHRSLLAMCIATLEVLVAGLATYHYEIHPHALGEKDVKLSLAELEDFDDLIQVREFAVSREVDALMFKGLEGWVRWLDKHSDLKLEELTPEYGLLYEAFQRRHAIVHNGGRVSRIYMARLQARGLEAPSLNDKLNVDSDYLAAILDELTFVGIAVGVRTWVKWRPGETSLMELELQRHIDEIVLAERWTVAKRLSEVGLEIAKKESAKCQLKIVQLMVIKLLEGQEAVQERLDAWDTSALDRPFQFAISALKGELDEVFRILDKLDLNKLPNPYWLKSPVFEEARADARWAQSMGAKAVPNPRTDSD